jgi:hypothetical protein
MNELILFQKNSRRRRLSILGLQSRFIFSNKRTYLIGQSRSFNHCSLYKDIRSLGSVPSRKPRRRPFH